MGSILRKANNNEMDIDRLHPQLLNNMMFYKAVKKNCTLGIYEDLPYQRKFWTETVDAFNKKNMDTEIELKFISAYIEKFHEYIEENLRGPKDFDAVQLPVLCTAPQSMIDALTINGKSFKGELLSDDYSIKKVFRYFPDAVSRILPVYMSIEAQLVDENILGRSNFETFGRLMNENPVDAWRMAVNKVPDNVYISNHTGDICYHIGFPWPPSGEKLSRRLYEEFTLMEILAGRGNGKSLAMSFDSIWYPQPRLKKILSEKIFSAYCPLILSTVIQERKKSMKLVLTGRDMPDTPCLGCEIALGVSSACTERSLFEDFGRFLLSEPVQRRIVREIHGLPFNHKAADELKNHVETFGDFTNAYSKYAAYSPEMAAFYFTTNLQQLFQDVYSKRLSVEDAVSKAKSFYNNNLRKDSYERKGCKNVA